MTNVSILEANGLLLQVEDEEESCSRPGARQELLDGNFNMLMPEGCTFVDVGANIGVVSIYMAIRNPSCKVISAEPFPSNYQMLTRNIVRSRMTNIIPVPFAISGHDTTEYWMIGHPSCTGGATHWSSRKAEGGHVGNFAIAITLDQLICRFVPAGPIVLKIDTEGSEHVILPMFHLWDRLIHLHLEIHTNDNTRRQGYSAEKLIALADEKLNPACTRKFHTVEMGS